MWNFLKKSKKKKEPKIKKYRFQVTDIVAVGDTYRYDVVGNSKDEAFFKLVTWFYGESQTAFHEDIEQNSFISSMPQRNHFDCYGMPLWFAQLLSGSPTTEQRMKLRHKLEQYALNNDIKLKS